MTKNQDPYAKDIFGSFIRTLVWSVGEVESMDFVGEEKEVENTVLKIQPGVNRLGLPMLKADLLIL